MLSWEIVSGLARYMHGQRDILAGKLSECKSLSTCGSLLRAEESSNLFATRKISITAKTGLFQQQDEYGLQSNPGHRAGNKVRRQVDSQRD